MCIDFFGLDKNDTQENISCSLVLKLKKVFIFRVFTGHTTQCVVYHLHTTLYGAMYQVLNTTQQVKADAIAISEDNHLAKIVSVFFFLLLYMY